MKSTRNAELARSVFTSIAAGAVLACQAASPQAKLASPPAEPLTAAAPPPQAPLPDVVAEIELRNPSERAREKEPVYFSFYALGLSPDDPRAGTLAVKSAGALVPSQTVDDDGNGIKDGLLALVDFKAAEVKSLSVVSDADASYAAFPKLTQAEISHKGGGSWQPRKDKPNLKEYVGGTFQNVQSLTAPPEHTDHSNFIRYEGPGIESDKVAYRVYLDWRNGFDIFGKKVTTPVLQKIGLDGFESYHHMADWGMDILKVGESLGAGGFGFFNPKKKKVELVSAVDKWTASVLENGNLYSALRIDYRGWSIDKKNLDLKADLAMTGGSRLVRARVGLSDELDNMAIGMVKHPGTELLQGSTNVTGTAYTYAASWGKQTLNDDMLGMAVLFRNADRRSQEDDGKSYVSVMKTAGRELDYYFLAAWAGEPGGIKTKEEFVAYLSAETERLTMPPRERAKTKLGESTKAFPITAEAALDWAKKLADSELARKTLKYRHDGWDENRGRKPKFEYDIVGLQPLAYEELSKVAPDPRYATVMEQVTGSYVSDKGELRAYEEKEYNIDSVNPGRNLLLLYEKSKAEKYKKAADVLRRQLKSHPKTSEGAFWHKKKYPWQVWLDGVYMGMPFLARYSLLFEQGKSYDEVVNEFVLVKKYLKSPETGLYFHGWDEKKQQDWANPQTGLSPEYWGRGLGWFAMALVDVLDVLPEGDTQHRTPLIEIVRELAPALVKVQDPATGTFWQVLDKPDAPGNYRESSASAMFGYFFAKATRKGYLHPSYQAVAQKTFEGLVKEFITVHPDGMVSMTNQCLVGGLGYGRDGSYRYYMSEPVWQNDPKGNGPFILAGVELYRLLAKKG